MKIIKVNAWETTDYSGYVTDVKNIDFDLNEEILSCFLNYDKGLDEDKIDELLVNGFWQTREIKNLKLTPFYNQTVRRQDVQVSFDVEAVVEISEAPNTRFVFEFSVDRCCEGDYGYDKDAILEVLEKEQESFINGELVTETQSALDELVKRIKAILIREETQIDFSELNWFKKKVYEKLRLWNYEMTADDLGELFSDFKISDKIDSRNLNKVENLFIDFEVDVIEKWKDQIDSYTNI